MQALCISLFGKFQICSTQHPPNLLDKYKVQELFCYLLLHRERTHTREGLSNLLWQNTPTIQAKKYLRKALWQLQSALDKLNRSSIAPVLLVESNWLQLNQNASMWLDVEEFEQACKASQGISGPELELAQFQALEKAVILYQGDLLEGWYQDWCLFERERLQRLYLIMLDKLIDYCEVHGHYETGLLYGSRSLCYDYARERTHRCLMRLYYLAGDRTEALRQYERCTGALQQELGVQPARSTKKLYEQIRADQLILSHGTAVPPHLAPTNPSSSLAKTLASLKQIQMELSLTQIQVQKNIEAVESTLNNDHQPLLLPTDKEQANSPEA